MTSLSKDTRNRLEQLPSELLEKVLLEVVSEVMPPTSSQANEEIKSGQTFASKLLAHRPISRPFCNHFWRALAKVVGETTFELCSRGSFEDLVAVSQCKKLVPWLNKLTFSITYPMEKHPTAEDDGQKKLSIADIVGPTLCRELMRIKNDDATWYPKVDVELLQHLHIDRLDIVNLQEKSWIPDNQLILGLTEGLLYGAAKEVVIRPPKDADRLPKFFTTLIESRETKNQNS
ncbi:hypothetical protein PTT_12264 [Pyrenophora teres f. teres 0-1]|uniref:Uncharacterized protein n=1 Tax=Pyrenophora teres f. teres (strain 0-1) TaxID=861557 RepID=E3RTE6_PYRTT|nr:hypothetical protein PTT_12264 [Pyrenophora teres f. teres 0-1]